MAFYCFQKRIPMIVWILIISLIVLIATTIFVYKMLVTSNELLSNDKRVFSKLLRTNTRDKQLKQSLETLNSKMKSLEDANSYYIMQFTRLQHQLGERAHQRSLAAISDTTHSLVSRGEEDWEEMYYFENETKVQLENELDATRQEMSLIKEKYSSLLANNENLVSLNIDCETRIAEIPALYNQINLIQMKLVTSMSREEELGRLLQKEMAQKKDYLKIQNENSLVKIKAEIGEGP